MMVIHVVIVSVVGRGEGEFGRGGGGIGKVLVGGGGGGGGPQEGHRDHAPIKAIKRSVMSFCHERSSLHNHARCSCTIVHDVHCVRCIQYTVQCTVYIFSCFPRTVRVNICPLWGQHTKEKVEVKNKQCNLSLSKRERMSQKMFRIRK